MSDKERNEYLRKLDILGEKLANDSVAAKKFLVAAGIINENGKLTEPYKNLCIPQDPA
jgi:hypothetical protein